MGAEDFVDWLAEKFSRRGRPGERAWKRLETVAALAERMKGEALTEARWKKIPAKRTIRTGTSAPPPAY